MIWLRLFIAVIALTISSDLSAWAQTMQVNSPEGFYDCKGIANGANTRDREGGCCLPSQQTEAPCFRCKPPNFCESKLNQCGTTATQDKNYRCCDAHPLPCNDCKRPSMTFCERKLNKCGATADRGCGCDKPAPGACGCDLSIKCCQNAFPPNIAPGITCVAFSDWGGCEDCAGTNKGFYSGTLTYYVDKQYGTCTGSSSIGEIIPRFMCGSIRCYGANCTAGNIGCFDPGTQILLEGGKLVPASDIRVGDRLYNPLSGRSFAVKRILVGPEEIPMVELGFDGHLLKVTQDHPVLTRDGMKRANTVRIGEVIVDASGNDKVLHYVRLAEIIPGQKALNFELDVDSQDPIDRLIVSDNITSGDLAVQNSELQGED